MRDPLYWQDIQDAAGQAASAGRSLASPATARPDHYNLREDAEWPGHPDSKGILLPVLGNDSIIGPRNVIAWLSTPLHGSATLADGPDADDIPGDAVFYVPARDYSGSDHFSYTIPNGSGFSTATVDLDISPVADVPQLSYALLPLPEGGAGRMLLRVTAHTSDADGSETISDIVLWDPPGPVSVGPEQPLVQVAPGVATRDFLLELSISDDTVLQLGAYAVASEQAPSGPRPSMAFGDIDIPIHWDVQRHETTLVFDSAHQGIWGPGGGLADQRQFGLHQDWRHAASGDVLDVATDGQFHAALASTLVAGDGVVTASLPYDVQLATAFNRSTDVLQVLADAQRTGGSFSTWVDSSDYRLDLLLDLALRAQLALRAPPAGQDPTLLQADLEQHLNLPVPPTTGFDVQTHALDLATSSAPDGQNRLVAEGVTSLMEADLDLGALAAALQGQPDPLAREIELDGQTTRIDLLDASLQAWMALRQHFAMTVEGISAQLVLEDGSSMAFPLGSRDGIVIQHASQHDANGDGHIDCMLRLTPQASIGNTTEIGHDFHWLVRLLQGLDGLDPTVAQAPGTGGADGESWDTVFDASFALALPAQDYWFVA